MRKILKNEKSFMEFFKKEWLEIVEKQIEANSQSSYIKNNIWNESKDFINQLVNDNKNNFEILFQNDKSELYPFFKQLIPSKLTNIGDYNFST